MAVEPYRLADFLQRVDFDPKGNWTSFEFVVVGPRCPRGRLKYHP